MIGDSGRVLIKDPRRALIRDPGRFPGEWIWDGSGVDLGGIWVDLGIGSGVNLGWIWVDPESGYNPAFARHRAESPNKTSRDSVPGSRARFARRDPHWTLSGPLF